jgi:hypothetical protein
VNDDEGGGRRESAPLGLPVDVELDDEDEDEDEDFEELDDDELMPNMHFGLASRAALEAEEGGGSTAPNYIFLINAVVEGSAALTAVFESFMLKEDRMLVTDDSSPMVRSASSAGRVSGFGFRARGSHCCSLRRSLLGCRCCACGAARSWAWPQLPT